MKNLVSYELREARGQSRTNQLSSSDQ